MKKAIFFIFLILAVSAYGACEQEKAQYDQAQAAYNADRSVQNQQMMTAAYQRYIECVGSMPATTNQREEPTQQYEDYSGGGPATSADTSTTQNEPLQQQQKKQTIPDDTELDDGDIQIVGKTDQEKTEDVPVENHFAVKLAQRLTRMLENQERTGTIKDPKGREVMIVYEDGAYYMEKDGRKITPSEYMHQLDEEETNYGTGLRTQTRQEELRRPEDAGYVTRQREYKPIESRTEAKIRERLRRVQEHSENKERATRILQKLNEIGTERLQDVDSIMEKELPEQKQRIETRLESLREKDERILEGAGLFKRFAVWMSGKIPIVGDTASKVYDKSLEVGIETGKMFAERNSERDRIWEEEFGY